MKTTPCGDSGKTIVMFLTVLLLSSIAFQAYSFNICEEAAKGLSETYATFNQNFDSYIKDHNATGDAIIRDVFPTSNSSEYHIILDCRNNVLLNTRSSSGSLKNLMVGQKVSFSGNVLGWRKRFYRDSDRAYVEILLGDSSISY
jgi:hypothetical protein